MVQYGLEQKWFLIFSTVGGALYALIFVLALWYTIKIAQICSLNYYKYIIYHTLFRSLSGAYFALVFVFVPSFSLLYGLARRLFWELSLVLI